MTQPDRPGVPRELAAARRRLEEAEAADAGIADAAAALAGIAERHGHHPLLMRAGRALERAERYGAAYDVIARAGWLNAGTAAPDWNGEPVGSLLVENRYRDIGLAIRDIRLLPLAAARAGRCIVRTEPRLVPLVARTFPHLDARPSGSDVAPPDAVAGLQSLPAFFARDAEAIRSSFVPLAPDPAAVAALRRDYLERLGGPLVGLFWRSSNEKKDVPGADFWAGLIGGSTAGFVSLQYGEVAAELAEQRRLAGRAAHLDPSVDQMADMDRFAAQIAALDAVVTISSTTAHLAGSLGVPCVTILDDNFALAWPATGETTPWYPAMRLVRRARRPWADVLVDATAALAAVLASGR